MITLRLSIMMFLQFFIWGLVCNTRHLFVEHASGQRRPNWYGVFHPKLGAIIAPFIVGLIADRFFNAERILGLLHLVGAALMYFMYQASDFASFYPYVLAYMIAYMPTLALVNSVSFGQMNDPSKQFGKVRVWGTVGWIVAGLMISYVFSWDSAQSIADGMLKNTFLLCSIASLALGIFSFTLPNTPPQSSDKAVGLRDVLGLDALALLKDKNFWFSSYLQFLFVFHWHFITKMPIHS
ncbi:hypothetical protein KUC3_02860 [Alteromonas sp. KC3]|nr:hypothetical protein KUC3_02860 [Alteromonas sp. KC3]